MNSILAAQADENSTNRVLFVDDEPFVLQGIRRALHGQFEADTAEGPEQGLAKLNEAPYAVVVSDMRMPGMDGAEFLSRVRTLAPDTVRVMLTGYADVESAMRAVNEGRIFRFLNKPVSSEELSQTLMNCLEHYRLLCGEKQLLEKTLAGAVRVLTEVLSLANPTAFNKGSRLRQYAKHIASKFGVKDVWEFEIAAMISELGCVTLPAELLESLHAGQELTADEKERVERHPVIGHDLIMHIPRMERVAEIVLRQNENVIDLALLQTPDAKFVRLGAQMLKVSLAFDRLWNDGMDRNSIVSTLMKDPTAYDSKIVSALADVQLSTVPMEFCEVDISELRVGMILKQDLRSPNGTLLIAKGQEVSLTMLKRARNFIDKGALGGRVRVLAPRASVGDTLTVS